MAFEELMQHIVEQQQQQKQQHRQRDSVSCPQLSVCTGQSPPVSPCMLRRKSLTLSCSDDDDDESSDCNFILDYLVLGSETISLDKKKMRALGVTVSATRLSVIVSSASRTRLTAEPAKVEALAEKKSATTTSHIVAHDLEVS
jgi:hypothetical protein